MSIEGTISRRLFCLATGATLVAASCRGNSGSQGPDSTALTNSLIAGNTEEILRLQEEAAHHKAEIVILELYKAEDMALRDYIRSQGTSIPPGDNSYRTDRIPPSAKAVGIVKEMKQGGYDCRVVPILKVSQLVPTPLNVFRKDAQQILTKNKVYQEITRRKDDPGTGTLDKEHVPLTYDTLVLCHPTGDTTPPGDVKNVVVFAFKRDSLGGVDKRFAYNDFLVSDDSAE